MSQNDIAGRGVAIGRDVEPHDVRVAALDAQLDPALMLVERLIRVDDEAHLLGPKRERAGLIARRDAGELDAFDHVRVRDKGAARNLHSPSRSVQSCNSFYSTQ